MKDTQQESGSSSTTTPATTQTKNTGVPVIDMEQAKTRLAIVAEDLFQWNQKTGGRMTMHATKTGLLVIVASLPGHRLGTKQSSSGITPTIDGETIV